MPRPFPSLVERYTKLVLCLLFPTALISPILDAQGFVIGGLGRIENFTGIIAGLFLPILFITPFYLSTKRERIGFGLILGAILFALLRTLAIPHDQVFSLQMLAGTVGAIGFGYAGHILSRHGSRIDRLLVGILVFSGLALCLPIALIAARPHAYSNFMDNTYGFGNVRNMGNYAALGIAALAGLFSVRRSDLSRYRWRSALALCALVLCWSFLCWSGARAGVVALGLALPAGLYIVRRLGIADLLLNAGAALSGLALSLLYHTPGGGAFGMLHRLNATVSAASHGNLNKITSDRTVLWHWIAQLISERPLTGYGYIPMRSLMDAQHHFYYAHNIILEYLLDFGIPAGGAMLALLALFILRGLTAARVVRGPVASGLAICIISIPVYALFSPLYCMPFVLLILFGGIGLLTGRAARRDLEISGAVEADTEKAMPRFKASVEVVFE